MKKRLNSNDPLAIEVEELRRRLTFLEESEAKNENVRAELLESSQNYRSILEASPS